MNSDPRHAHAVADLALGDARSQLHHVAHRLVAQRAGELRGQVALGDVHVGVAQPAGLDADEDLARAGLGRGDFLDGPLAVDLGHDGGFHEDLRSMRPARGANFH
jgi:hypothetical protein